MTVHVKRPREEGNEQTQVEEATQPMTRDWPLILEDVAGVKYPIFSWQVSGAKEEIIQLCTNTQCGVRQLLQGFRQLCSIHIKYNIQYLPSFIGFANIVLALHARTRLLFTAEEQIQFAEYSTDDRWNEEKHTWEEKVEVKKEVEVKQEEVKEEVKVE